MGKKKKRAESEAEAEQENKVDTTRRRSTTSKAALIPTVSVAVPGSIIHNAQSLELATRLAGQIARAMTIFRIDEVVIFDNKSESGSPPEANSDEDESGAAFLVRILRYLETPQYLRKALFPKHNSLRFVGMLPPLDAPHHLRKHEWGPFREVSLFSVSTYGLILRELANVIVDQVLEPGTRVTVAMGANRNLDADISRQVVSSSKPREEAGTYWGYKVRYASNITSVRNECHTRYSCVHSMTSLSEPFFPLPIHGFLGGYDHSIGTSEHGQIINSSDLTIPTFRHLLIAFGGLAGLEESIEEDNNLKAKNVREVFDLYLNTCPHQGSRTIRTEDIENFHNWVKMGNLILDLATNILKTGLVTLRQIEYPLLFRRGTSVQSYDPSPNT
ncbi:hypothetical protein Prudu_001291 [Prunus dulcis]|uniref:Uncharacterized protein n=1 Tax=Prunus dulcis TaxID=3755 RepID=A0A4Y1QNE7_PRUDU|nr:hypothetical protein Prudu_001291 [Prunus dulcis]